MKREYFYTVNLKGNLVHDNTEIFDHDFVDYFYSHLKSNNTGMYSEYPFVSQCGNEFNYLHALDTPFVFSRLENNRLFYTSSLSFEFSRENLRFSSEGILYHRSPLDMFGRIDIQLVMELSKWIKPFGHYYCYQDPNDTFLWVIEPLHPLENTSVLRPKKGNSCVGCGQDSIHGLYLSYIFDTNEITATTWIIAGKSLEGSLGMMHGGYVSLLLDEVMGKVLSGMGIKAPTANLNIRFKKPTPIGKVLKIHGTLVKIQGRKLFLIGHILDEEGIVLAESEGLFINILHQ